MVVCGRGYDGRGYFMHDASDHYSPDAWARKAVELYHEYDADRIIGEVNNGGDMVGAAAWLQVSLVLQERRLSEPRSNAGD